METQKSDFLLWVQAHKKQLIFAGISIVAVFGIIIGLKNKDTLVELWETLEKKAKKVPQVTPSSVPVVDTALPEIEVLKVPRYYTPPDAPVPVRLHVRNLPKGRMHSTEKAAEAEALGIILLPHQTLVDPYIKYAA